MPTKIILLGDEAVGKTSLVSRWTIPLMFPYVDRTIGIECKSHLHKYMEKLYKLQFWDCSGTKSYHSLYDTYIYNSNIAVVVFDVTKPKTFRNVDFWLQMVIKKHGKKFPICLIANKIDRESERRIHMEDIKLCVDKIDANIIVLETSATHNINCDNSFRVMLSRISNLEILTTTVDNRTWFQKLFGV